MAFAAAISMFIAVNEHVYVLLLPMMMTMTMTMMMMMMMMMNTTETMQEAAHTLRSRMAPSTRPHHRATLVRAALVFTSA